jgi:hypothetical protein
MGVFGIGIPELPALTVTVIEIVLVAVIRRK